MSTWLTRSASSCSSATTTAEDRQLRLAEARELVALLDAVGRHPASRSCSPAARARPPFAAPDAGSGRGRPDLATSPVG
jgi:hypothetical protein